MAHHAETRRYARVRQKQQTVTGFEWSRMRITGRTHACGHTDTGAVSGEAASPATYGVIAYANAQWAEIVAPPRRGQADIDA